MLEDALWLSLICAAEVYPLARLVSWSVQSCLVVHLSVFHVKAFSANSRQALPANLSRLATFNVLRPGDGHRTVCGLFFFLLP